MDPYHIFIVEDDLWYGEILEYHLCLNPDYKVTRFARGEDCLAKMYLKPDLVTIDLTLPDINGEQLFKRLREINPSIPVIVISGQEDVAYAVNLLKKGVNDYLVKNDTTKDLLWNTIIHLREHQELKKEVEKLRNELGQKFSFEKTMIGQSEPLKKVFGLIEKAIRTNINVSISGETGTGKEVVAKAIHYNSDRHKKKFVAVNMAAIPSELVESELFGHEKGSFTGAVSRKIGKFEEANGGTLFMDEVAEMEPAHQTKLLRVLQERELVRVGGNEKVQLDIRLIVATHKNLLQEVKKGNFREDLYYRIYGFPIELPPLRERGNDILILAKHFVNEFTKENKMGSVQISDESKKKLLSYPYPGNVRELKAIVELAVAMCNDKIIQPVDLTFHGVENNGFFINQSKSLKEYNRDIIRHHLQKNNNDVIATAHQLDIGKSTIYKMIQAGELTIPEQSGIQ